MSYDLETTLALLKKSKEGNKEAKEKLVKDNLPLVWSMVKRYQNSYYDREDLFQIGCLGLLKAIDKFDLNYGVYFSTYAVPLILGEIKKFFRDDGTLKVSRYLKELNIKINNLNEEFYLSEGRKLRIEEVSKKLNVPSIDIIMALDSNYYPTSIDEIIYERDDSSLRVSDRIGYEDSDKLINLITLKDSLKKLNDKERLLINLRYYQNYNQSEVAKRFNVSQVQISRMEKKIYEKLRKNFG